MRVPGAEVTLQHCLSDNAGTEAWLLEWADTRVELVQTGQRSTVLSIIQLLIIDNITLWKYYIIISYQSPAHHSLDQVNPVDHPPGRVHHIPSCSQCWRGWCPSPRRWSQWCSCSRWWRGCRQHWPLTLTVHRRPGDHNLGGQWLN